MPGADQPRNQEAPDVSAATDHHNAQRTGGTGRRTAQSPPTSGDRQHNPARRDGHQRIVLDADLPPPNTTSGLSGLDELSMVNRAVGILINEGHHPNHAHTPLGRSAAEAGVEPHSYPARLLRR